MNDSAKLDATMWLAAEKRTEYLRGIAASAPERHVDMKPALHAVYDAIFAQLHNQNDWMNPINALVQIDQYDKLGLGLYLDAIEYFTGCKAEVFIHSDNEDRTKTTFRIVAEGYRLAQ